MPAVSNSLLHYTILKFVVEHGYGPRTSDLAANLNTAEEDIVTGLQSLQEEHGVVLHPDSSNIWVIHPFSLAPTNFLLRDTQHAWWANCAWCALGAAALLNRDCTITTTLGADDKQVRLSISNGKLLDPGFCVHFPVPMRQAWDNVIYTCSMMLLFENEQHINRWCQEHRIQRGDIQSVEKIWEFSKVWYGNHLNPGWKKWTTVQAQEMFNRFDFTHDIWKLAPSGTRF